VRVSTDLNIEYSVTTICHQSTVWTVDNYDGWRKQRFVTTNGVEGNPGSKTIYNWFKIEKNGDDYYLRYCPTVCNYCDNECRDLGIYIDETGVRRLAIDNVPFKVKFQKA
ncbi:hypothetical protein Tsubulata_022230, partial [Turnera subulata]